MWSPLPGGKDAPGQTSASAERPIAILSQDKQVASAPLGASIRAEDVMLDVPAGAPTDLLVKLSASGASA